MDKEERGRCLNFAKIQVCMFPNSLIFLSPLARCVGAYFPAGHFIEPYSQIVEERPLLSQPETASRHIQGVYNYVQKTLASFSGLDHIKGTSLTFATLAFCAGSNNMSC